MNKPKERDSFLYNAMVFFQILVLSAAVLYVVFSSEMLENARFFVVFPYLFFLMGLLVLASLLQTLIHESGHLVFGLLSGFTFVSFRVGASLFFKENGKLKRKKFGLKGTGGQCLLLPPDVPQEDAPYKRYLWGGVWMNVLSLVLFVPLFLLCRQVPVAGSFFLFMAVLGAVYAMLNGVPVRSSYVVNDGYNIRLIGRDKSLLPLLYSQLHIAANLTDGVRIKDMPASLFALPPEVDYANPLVCGLAANVTARCIDKKEFDIARRWIEFLLQSAPGLLGVHRKALQQEQLFLELITYRRPELLHAWYTPAFEKQLKLAKLSPNSFRIRFAWALLVQNNLPAAQEALAGFEKAAGTYPFQADLQSERELIAIVQQQSPLWQHAVWGKQWS